MSVISTEEEFQLEAEMGVLADEDWELVAKAIEEICGPNPSDDCGVGRANGEDNGNIDDIWYERVKQGRWDAVSALVLSFLSNMEHLAVEGWKSQEFRYSEYCICIYDHVYDHLQDFMQKAAQSQEIANRKTEEESQSDAAPNSHFVETKAALLPKCRTLNIYYYDDLDNCVDLRYVPPFMLPPSVEVFNVNDRKINHTPCDWGWYMYYTSGR